MCLKGLINSVLLRPIGDILFEQGLGNWLRLNTKCCGKFEKRFRYVYVLKYGSSKIWWKIFRFWSDLKLLAKYLWYFVYNLFLHNEIFTAKTDSSDYTNWKREVFYSNIPINFREFLWLHSFSCQKYIRWTWIKTIYENLWWKHMQIIYEKDIQLFMRWHWQ